MKDFFQDILNNNDNLPPNGNGNIPNDLEGEIKRISLEALPKKCQSCFNASICTILHTLLTISESGIEIDIKKCPYYKSNCRE